MPPKQLGALLSGWIQNEDGNAMVNGLSLDSRSVMPGDLYFAYPGSRYDGRDYIRHAVTAGAVAIAAEPGELPRVSVPVVEVPELRHQVGVIAARFFDQPAQSLFIVGITGTNGKTSCAHLLTQAFCNLGVRTGFIGTLGQGFIGQLDHSPHTTPDPIALQRRLRTFLAQGATHICMEASSHALAQRRVSGIEFDVAIFTNLSHDHLDYHRDLEAYAEAKASLFRDPGLRFAIINRDDEFGNQLAQMISTPTWTYGLDRADVTAKQIETQVYGINLTLNAGAQSVATRAHLVGRLNVHNILAVSALLLADGRELTTIGDVVGRLQPVPGRMELFHGNSGTPVVVVDYAHTPDALERALLSVREHCRGRLWCVFGCGGDRDRQKRPVMGAIAERLADDIIVTDDNPRNEPASDITTEIAAGMSSRPKIVHDRARAIQDAIADAGGDDWVLVAGKGHETTQQIGNDYFDFDDRVVVNRCLEAAA